MGVGCSCFLRIPLSGVVLRNMCFEGRSPLNFRCWLSLGNSWKTGGPPSLTGLVFTLGYAKNEIGFPLLRHQSKEVPICGCSLSLGTRFGGKERNKGNPWFGFYIDTSQKVGERTHQTPTGGVGFAFHCHFLKSTGNNGNMSSNS